MHNALRNIKFQFTVIATYPSGTSAVFRVAGRGYRQVREDFESSGFKVIQIHRDGDAVR